MARADEVGLSLWETLLWAIAGTEFLLSSIFIMLMDLRTAISRKPDVDALWDPRTHDKHALPPL